MPLRSPQSSRTGLVEGQQGQPTNKPGGSLAQGSRPARPVEPGPGVVAERAREARDNVIRHDMLIDLAREVGIGIQEAGARHYHATVEIYRLISGHRWAQYTATVGPIEAEVAKIAPLGEEIKSGKLFVMKALRATGPAGSKLVLYAGSPHGENFVEVVSNIQQYSGEIPGGQVVKGPCQLWAEVTGATEGGTAYVRLEGNLVNREAC